MQGRELYKKYHRLFDDMAKIPKPRQAWLDELHCVLRKIEDEVEILDPVSSRLLREDLCEQLEHEALRARSTYGHDVLLVAVKHLEQMNFPTQKR
jgi:hypothetical protein